LGVQECLKVHKTKDEGEVDDERGGEGVEATIREKSSGEDGPAPGPAPETGSTPGPASGPAPASASTLPVWVCMSYDKISRDGFYTENSCVVVDISGTGSMDFVSGVPGVCVPSGSIKAGVQRKNVRDFAEKIKTLVVDSLAEARRRDILNAEIFVGFDNIGYDFVISQQTPGPQLAIKASADRLTSWLENIRTRDCDLEDVFLNAVHTWIKKRCEVDKDTVGPRADIRVRFRYEMLEG
jgi:hypothetical protein